MIRRLEGCQWRALPSNYPNWNTVHRYYLRWSKDGTWKRVVERLTKISREQDGRDPDPSGPVIDARSVRGACTVTSSTRGYDAGKRVSGRKTLGIVDTMGLLLDLVVVAASVLDNAGGIMVTYQAKERSERLSKIFCEVGFKMASNAADITSPLRSYVGSIPITSKCSPNVESWSERGHGS